jgi:hypothetical protein
MEYNVTIEPSGWWTQLETLDLSLVNTELPRAGDRFDEAKQFLWLVIELQPNVANLRIANWYSGAHIGAVIGIRDAAETDCRNRQDIFSDLPIAREFFLELDAPDPVKRDPLGINRAYREYRHLRTHFGCPVLRLEARTLVQDIGSGQEPPLRWFFSPLNGPEILELKRKQLTLEQRGHFDDFAKHKTFVELAAPQLYMLGRALQSSAELLAGSKSLPRTKSH